MAFSELTGLTAFVEAMSQCECRRLGCGHPGHPGRCTQMLHAAKRGSPDPDGWEPDRRDPSRGEDVHNCVVLCSHCAATCREEAHFSGAASSSSA